MVTESIENPSSESEKRRVDHRSEQIQNALRGLVRDFCLQEFGLRELPEDLHLELSFILKKGRFELLSADPELDRQLREQIAPVLASSDGFSSGRVYCFRCESAVCEHGLPETAEAVFSGFDAMGSPTWLELGPFLLEQGVDEVASLYQPDPKVLVAYQKGKDLKAKQLASFGKASKTYNLLAQVCCGYFYFSNGDRFALTFQAVETRVRHRPRTIHLNTVFALSEDCDIGGYLLDHLDWVRQAAKRTEEGLKKLEKELQFAPKSAGSGNTNRILGRVPELMRRLMSDLQRGREKDRRKTRHARERKAIKRPVDKAPADLAAVRPDRLFWDNKTKAVVLLAERGRCHIYNAEAHHITSFTISAESALGRIRKKRWSPLEEEQRREFLALAGGGTADSKT